MFLTLLSVSMLLFVRQNVVVAYTRINPFSRLNKGLATTSLTEKLLKSKHKLSSTITSSPVVNIIPKNFIKNIIENDIAQGKNEGRVVTRFPPEPNGYLHLGHAKSICFNFGVAKEYNGVTHMRFDDTNPAKEDMEYVTSILKDVRWLVSDGIGTDPWSGPVRHASDYFDKTFEAAMFLIRAGKAYVDDSTPDEMRAMRGTLTEPGVNSPYRSRTPQENEALFLSMKNGELPDGRCVLRAKIDMSSSNMNLRDPTLYRIKRASHPITGDAWCIYPMYDFAHAISDAVEEITHSLCTLEFADHRPLYDWVIDELMPSKVLPSQIDRRPTQIEFSRLNLQYTVLSKRKLIQLVTEGHVTGWDDPRMPTISGVRRRGFPAAAVRLFCERVGISKAENNIDIGVLEDCAREVLDETAPRAFGVLDPIKVTITNYDSSAEEEFKAERNPRNADLGERSIMFASQVYIDREDFFDTGNDGSIPVPSGFKRLVPGGQVRLKYAYVIKCDEVIRDSSGRVSELLCSYDPATRAGATPPSSTRVKGIIQWVAVKHAVPIQATLYDRLFCNPSPGKDQPDDNFLLDLNPDSVKLVPGFVESDLASAAPGDTFQFERVGYFCVDEKYNGQLPLQLNRVVTLKDNWASKQLSIAIMPSSTPSAADDILRVEIRVGKILSAEKHPDAESLFIETIDCGSAGIRTVVSGIAKYIPLESLEGKLVAVVCNLKPAKMRGVNSEGMLLAASKDVNGSEIVELLEAPQGSQVGELIQVEGLGLPVPDPLLKSKTAQDMYKRVSSSFSTNSLGEAVYGSRRFIVSSGAALSVPSLKDASVR